jgi:hypothetical protein
MKTKSISQQKQSREPRETTKTEVTLMQAGQPKPTEFLLQN